MAFFTSLTGTGTGMGMAALANSRSFFSFLVDSTYFFCLITLTYESGSVWLLRGTTDLDSSLCEAGTFDPGTG